METIGIKEQFIELRARGYSYDKIAKELGKAKQTLIDWGKELDAEIANRKALELEVLYEEQLLLKEARLKRLGGILTRLEGELNKRELSDLSTDKLLDLYLRYIDKVEAEYLEPVFKSTEEINAEYTENRYMKKLIMD
ncbi:MAG: hypothetical protein RBT66_04850 [bacterium]|jgi:transposase-like protein|nr:hypothetical protein [bacterium]